MDKNSVSVRYIVNDVAAAIDFYKTMFDFTEVMHPAPEFAILKRGNLLLLLSQPSGIGGGGKEMADGTTQIPGGWNRFEITVDDLESKVAELKQKECTFRNEIVAGVGGKQILAVDPSGNLIELFEYFKK